MVKAHSLLDAYQALLVMTTTMLDAAAAENWSALLDLQNDYVHLSQMLMSKRAAPLKQTLTDQQQTAIRQYIRQIIRNQNQLQSAVLCRRNQLRELICHTVSQHAQIKRYYQVVELV